MHGLTNLKNCQIISQHQEIEFCLQVYDTNCIVRVIKSTNILFWLHFQFIQNSFLYMHKNFSLYYKTYDFIYKF